MASLLSNMFNNNNNNGGFDFNSILSQAMSGKLDVNAMQNQVQNMIQSNPEMKSIWDNVIKETQGKSESEIRQMVFDKLSGK